MDRNVRNIIFHPPGQNIMLRTDSQFEVCAVINKASFIQKSLDDCFTSREGTFLEIENARLVVFYPFIML